MTNTLNISEEKHYTLVQIDNGKVNGITTELLVDLRETFLRLDKEESNKAIILAGRPHCFSAGIDIVSYAKDTDEGRDDFWVAFHSAIQAMVRYSKPFVCAITGYAPAGATILTCTADYRIMGKGAKHRIGMHEFKMSMQIPEFLCDIYAYTIGEKNAWEAVQQAKLFTSDEAVAIGLVNESVEVEEVLDRAAAYIKRQVQVYPKVFQQSKKYFRKELLKKLDIDIPTKVKEFADFNKDPNLKAMLEIFLTSLKK